MLAQLTELEKLQDYAYTHHIDVYLKYSDSEHKGTCLVSDTGHAVLINKRVITNDQEEICILAEEIGHIETNTVLPAGDYLNPYYKRYLKRQNEVLASRSAIQRLLPPERVQEAADTGHRSINSIAGYCGVTPELVEEALSYYKRKGHEFE